MNTYTVFYSTLEGDDCKVWVEASSKDEAIMKAKSEHWDIDTISQVLKR